MQLLLNIVWVKLQYKPKINIILISYDFYIIAASQIQSLVWLELLLQVYMNEKIELITLIFVQLIRVAPENKKE